MEIALQAPLVTPAHAPERSAGASVTRWKGWVVVLACAILLAGCASAPGSVTPTPLSTPVLPATRPSGDAAGHLAAADAALERNDLATAEREYKDAVGLDPQSAKAQFGLGNVYLRQQRLDAAETAYRTALALDPKLAAAQTNLGVTYYQMEQLPKAAEALQAALKIEPQDAKTLYLLGAVRIQEGKLTEAEQLLTKARDLDPKLPEVYYGLGVLYKLKEQKRDAIAAFEKFLAIGPGQDPSAKDYAQRELNELKGQ